MSTGEQLEIWFGCRAAGIFLKRLFSNAALLGPWSPRIIPKIYIAVDDRYVSKNSIAVHRQNFR